MKIVYQTNRGYYVSETYCQESPLQKGVFLVPSECIEEKPPKVRGNEVPYWNGNNWEVKPNYSGKKYYSKIDKSEKSFEKGEEFDSKYTEVSPMQNESFQKWDEQLNSWILDEETKKDFELKERQSAVQKLLLQSDYIELPSFLERKGQEAQSAWLQYRAALREAYHNVELPIPGVPFE